jgi:hypothetical protein
MSRRRTKEKPVEHHLITVALGPHSNLHCYLMSTDKTDTLDAAKKLLFEAEKMAGPQVLPMILATPLDANGIKLVREIIYSHNAEAKRLLQEATSFHFAIFSMPEDEELMQLH